MRRTIVKPIRIILVKLQKKEYSKWVVVLPNDKIEQTGWKEGVELDLDAKKGVITLRPKDSNN